MKDLPCFYSPNLSSFTIRGNLCETRSLTMFTISYKNFRQTSTEPGKGNALQVCMAVILQTNTVAEVPNFIEAEVGYLQSIHEYLLPLKLTFLKIDLQDGKLMHPCSPGTLCVLAGKSPRGNHKHCVVGRVSSDKVTFEMYHDPHASDLGLEDYQWAGFVVKMCTSTK